MESSPAVKDLPRETEKREQHCVKMKLQPVIRIKIDTEECLNDGRDSGGVYKMKEEIKERNKRKCNL